MPQDAAGRAGCDVAFEDVQIRAANGGLGNADEGIGGIGDIRLGSFLQRLFAAALIGERSHGGCPDIMAYGLHG